MNRFIIGMHGLGDAIYSRPFVREAMKDTRFDTYLSTPWPELYGDLEGLRLVNPHSQFRVQAKHVARERREWWPAPKGGEHIPFAYGPHSVIRHGSIVKALQALCEWQIHEPLQWDLPHFNVPVPVSMLRPLAVIRPVTLRREWRHESRAPDPRYIHVASRILQARGFHVVSIADLEHEREWAVPPMPLCDTALHEGQLRLEELVTLVRLAAVVVGGVGFNLPMALATGTPQVVIGGGSGVMNSPWATMDTRMHCENTRWLLPEPYCTCNGMDHDCNKHIADFPAKFNAALDEVAL